MSFAVDQSRRKWRFSKHEVDRCDNSPVRRGEDGSVISRAHQRGIVDTEARHNALNEAELADVRNRDDVLLRAGATARVPSLPTVPRGQHTRAALIATALTVPLVVVLALLFSLGDSGGSGSSATSSDHPLAPLTVSAPPSNAATAAPCAKILAQLPVSVGDLAPRVVHPQPDSPFVVAWGDPPVVLRCGVGRPPTLVVGSADLTYLVNGVLFVASNTDKAHVFTAVDREAYVEIAVPKSYSQPPLGPIASAIAKALPAICSPQAGTGEPEVPADQLCTHRK